MTTTTTKENLEKRILSLGRSSLDTNIPVKFIVGGLRRTADGWRYVLQEQKASNASDVEGIRKIENTIYRFDHAIESLIRAFTANASLLAEHGMDERGVDTSDVEFETFDTDDNDPQATCEAPTTNFGV